jgi:hypothetical protein
LRIAVVSALLLAAFATALAQGLTLSGTVRDPSGNPMPGVTVRLATRSEGVRVTSTDEKGKYLFTGLDVAFYPVIFEREGYTTVTRRMQVTFDDDDVEPGSRDVTMTPEPKTK